MEQIEGMLSQRMTISGTLSSPCTVSGELSERQTLSGDLTYILGVAVIPAIVGRSIIGQEAQ